MPPKKKPPARPAPRPAPEESNIPDLWRRHPKVTLASIATIIGIIVSIGPLLLWMANYYETHSAAQIAYSKQRQALEFHKSAVYRNLAWAAVADARRDATVARNRVNDCNIKRDKREAMSALERAACGQYEDDLASSNKRLEQAQAAAMQSSREKEQEKEHNGE